MYNWWRTDEGRTDEWPTWAQLTKTELTWAVYPLCRNASVVVGEVRNPTKDWSKIQQSLSFPIYFNFARLFLIDKGESLQLFSWSSRGFWYAPTVFLPPRSFYSSGQAAAQMSQTKRILISHGRFEILTPLGDNPDLMWKSGVAGYVLRFWKVLRRNVIFFSIFFIYHILIRAFVGLSSLRGRATNLWGSHQDSVSAHGFKG